MSAGSSPLARGLPTDQLIEDINARIIPARAGFTRQRNRRHRKEADHPRSRGVYDNPPMPYALVGGSSPLARGLPHPRQCRVRDQRIIPARAGFTRRLHRCRGARADHPRSRGVYVSVFGGRAGGRGSSPLARGLHSGFHEVIHKHGIIPARAGFTDREPHIIDAVSDHPRSRGVYYSAANDTHQSRGIIPARAGFTLGDRRDSNGGPPYQGAFAFTGDLGTARLSCGSVVAGQRSTTTPSPV